MAKEKRDHSVQLKVSTTELDNIERWQALKGISSRNEAIRQMVFMTLQRDGAEGAVGLAEKNSAEFMAPGGKKASAEAGGRDDVLQFLLSEIAELKEEIKALKAK